MYKRYFTLNENGANIEAGKKTTVSGGAESADNSTMLPYRFYGIK